MKKEFFEIEDKINDLHQKQKRTDTYIVITFVVVILTVLLVIINTIIL